MHCAMLDSFKSRRAYSLINSKYYEPLAIKELLKKYKDLFTGLGCLPVGYHTEVDPAIKP